MHTPELGFRHVESHHRDDDLPVGVGRISEHAAVARLAFLGGATLEVRVLADRSLHGLEHAREVDVAIEDDDRGLGIAPAQVIEELSDGVQKGLLAAPELAFADENVAVLNADQDVGLAGEVEGLA
jgi:hypothetical protein